MAEGKIAIGDIVEFFSTMFPGTGLGTKWRKVKRVGIVVSVDAKGRYGVRELGRLARRRVSDLVVVGKLGGAA